MDYLDALKNLNQGLKIKLPEWGGYWYKEVNIVNGIDYSYVRVFTKEGLFLDTPSIQFMLRTDWLIFKD